MIPMQATKEKETNQRRIEEMFNAGAHFGYSKMRRHPSVKPFIFGTKNNIEIIDLEKTDALLSRALEFVHSLGREGKKILFVGTKSEIRSLVRDAARSLEMPYVDIRWIGGTISNFPQIKKRLLYFEDLMSKRSRGELEMYTKKERLMIDRELSRLEKKFGGMLTMRELPSALFIVDSRKEHSAIEEARNKRIPTISLSGSDCDIKAIDYPILANDASPASVKFFVGELVAAYREGKQNS